MSKTLKEHVHRHQACMNRSPVRDFSAKAAGKGLSDLNLVTHGEWNMWRDAVTGETFRYTDIHSLRPEDMDSILYGLSLVARKVDESENWRLLEEVTALKEFLQQLHRKMTSGFPRQIG